jgi:hypothetical protein
MAELRVWHSPKNQSPERATERRDILVAIDLGTARPSPPTGFGDFWICRPGACFASLRALIRRACGTIGSLQPVLEDDGTLFIIFSDGSNRSDTAILDFNKAENPPRAFTPYATCPLPPAGNSLDVEIKTGEKR